MKAMKCAKCGKELKDEKHYEIDVYRFGFGIGINYLEEVILCQKCFEEIEWLKKGGEKNE